MDIREKVSLKEWTFWKIGGPADFFCTPKTVEEVREAVEYARGKGLPVTVLGGGTNVLVSDQGVAGLVIGMKHLSGVTSEEREGRVHVEALAGTPEVRAYENIFEAQARAGTFLVRIAR